jgi:hypothetical protein
MMLSSVLDRPVELLKENKLDDTDVLNINFIVLNVVLSAHIAFPVDLFSLALTFHLRAGPLC